MWSVYIVVTKWSRRNNNPWCHNLPPVIRPDQVFPRFKCNMFQWTSFEFEFESTTPLKWWINGGVYNNYTHCSAVFGLVLLPHESKISINYSQDVTSSLPRLPLREYFKINNAFTTACCILHHHQYLEVEINCTRRYYGVSYLAMLRNNV